MDHERFRDWFSHVDELTAAQRKEVATVLSDPPEGAASLAAIELGVDDERRCPHCGSAGAVSRGKARGLRRYRCKTCGKTFGALTGTALSGLHHKERWLAFGASLGAGETIREQPSAAALRRARRFAGATASWRRCARRRTGLRDRRGGRDLRSGRAGRGSGKLDRKPRRRGSARPANAVSRASRCRFWSPPTVPARPSAKPCPLSTQRA